MAPKTAPPARSPHDQGMEPIGPGAFLAAEYPATAWHNGAQSGLTASEGNNALSQPGACSDVERLKAKASRTSVRLAFVAAEYRVGGLFQRRVGAQYVHSNVDVTFVREGPHVQIVRPVDVLADLQDHRQRMGRLEIGRDHLR